MVRMRSVASTHAEGLDAEARGLGALGDVLAIWAHPDDETYLAGGLVTAVGRERFSAWVATESFALPLATR